MATEDDKINTGALATVVAVGALGMIGVSLAVNALVRHEVDSLGANRDATGEVAYRSLKDAQERKLSAPAAWSDAAKGQASIPIERAMGLVLADLKRSPWNASPVPPPDAGAGAAPSVDPTQAADAGAADADAGAAEADAGASGADAGAAPEPPAGTPLSPSVPAPSTSAKPAPAPRPSAAPPKPAAPGAPTAAAPKPAAPTPPVAPASPTPPATPSPMTRRTPALLLALAILVAGSTAWAHPGADGSKAEGPGPADRTEPLPKPLQAVDVKEHLGANVPKTLGFVDETGRPVVLGDYMDGKLPVVFTFNYSNCPMLCSLMLSGFVRGLKELDYTPGKEFRVVTVSIDPKETPERAQKTQHHYLGSYGKPEAKDGWHFLTGSENNVRAYANALGVGYTFVPERNEYAHPAVLAVASPDGKIVRYLYGVEYPPQNLKLSLLEASQGKIGTAFDRLILYCFHYDANQGKYAPVAANVMRVGGAVAVILLVASLVLLFRADAKKRRRLAESPT